jgi:hypothetical protein
MIAKRLIGIPNHRVAQQLAADRRAYAAVNP